MCLNIALILLNKHINFSVLVRKTYNESFIYMVTKAQKEKISKRKDLVNVPGAKKSGKFREVYGHRSSESNIILPVMATEEWAFNSTRPKVEGYINEWLPLLKSELSLVDDNDVEAIMELEEGKTESSDDTEEGESAESSDDD
jgi:hypothetical protein